jgi:phosphatidylserine decarboxylase
MPTNIRSIQPGGGAVAAIELAWGRLRRLCLKTFFPGYVRDMKARLNGRPESCPVEVIDARDLKYFQNVAECWFEPPDTRFDARDRIPLARWGLAEAVLFAGGGGAAALICLWPLNLPLVAPLPALFAAFVLYFFRDPRRDIPAEPGLVVSPADGKIVEIADVDAPEFLGEPAVKIGIFLSVFNVHVNRAATDGRVVRLRYQPGKFLNALRPSSAEENERMEIFLVEPDPPHRRYVVRQIAGAIARRIVCTLRPGQEVARGERFGMIKFGSRTEILLPRAGFEVSVRIGQKVRGGQTVLGRYSD